MCRKVLASVMVAGLAVAGCSALPSRDEVAAAAQLVLAAAIEKEVMFLPEPFPFHVDATVAHQHVTESAVEMLEADGQQDDSERRLVHQEVTVGVQLTPVAEARSMLRVVPDGGRLVTIEATSTVTMRRGENGWTAVHTPEVVFKESDALSAADRESVRYTSAEAIMALFSYDGDVDAYNAKQVSLELGGYATRSGVAGVAEPRLDPPPTLTVQGPTWRAPGDRVYTYGSAWLRPSAPSQIDRQTALWLLDVLSTADTKRDCERFDLTRMSTDGPSFMFTESHQSQLYDALVVEGETDVTAAGWSRCDGGFSSEPVGTRGAATVKVRYRATVVRLRGDEEWVVSGLSLSPAWLRISALPEGGSDNLYQTGTWWYTD